MPKPLTKQEHGAFTQRLDIRCSQGLIDACDRGAARAGVDRSEWIRFVLWLATGEDPSLTEVARVWGQAHNRRLQRQRNRRAQGERSVAVVRR